MFFLIVPNFKFIMRHLVVSERAGIAAKPKVVITSDSDVESRYAGGSLLTPPAGPHATGTYLTTQHPLLG